MVWIKIKEKNTFISHINLLRKICKMKDESIYSDL